MKQPTEFVLLVSDKSYVRLFKRIVVQLHGIDLEEAFRLLKAGGHLSSAWSLEDFLCSVRSGRMTDLVEPSPIPAPVQKEGIIPFAFGDELVRAKLDAQGNPWFVAKDVCRVLELGNVTEATRGLDEDERGSEFLNTSGGRQEMLTISESGLYSLIFRSRKDEARAFRRWVTSEVLPTIRRTGVYRQPAAPYAQEVEGEE
ncbi:MAG: BRO family protein [Desulfovibrionaceae bacterium]|nr:BRO family protein [Desulfovibrionaceae bacterium]